MIYEEITTGVIKENITCNITCEEGNYRFPGIPPGTYRIGAYTGGYTRDIGVFGAVQTGIGANLTAYTLPDTLKPEYGAHPWGVSVYLRLRLRSAE